VPLKKGAALGENKLIETYLKGFVITQLTQNKLSTFAGLS